MSEFKSIFHEAEIALNEVYFGKTSEILAIEAKLHDFREKYMEQYIFNTTMHNDKLLLELEDMIADYFGMKTFTLYIVNNITINGFTLAITTDPTYMNRKDVCVKNNNGIKFNKKYGFSVFVCTFSAILLNPGFTDGEIMALILHEIGHNFFLALNRKLMPFSYLHTISQYIIALSQHPEELATIALNTNLVKNVILGKYKEDREENTIGTLFLNIGTDTLGLFFSAKSVVDSLKSLFRFGTDSIIKIPLYLYKQLTNAWNLITIPLGYKNEVTADNFASLYGYSVETASLQQKIMDNKYAVNPVDKYVEKLPIISHIMGLNYDIIIFVVGLFDVHPEQYDRINSQVLYLERELSKQDISPKARKEIMKNLEATKDELEKCQKLLSVAEEKHVLRKIHNKFLGKIGGSLKYKALTKLFGDNFDNYDDAFNSYNVDEAALEEKITNTELL